MKKKLHFNKPQLRSLLMAAPVEFLIAGRGTGKTEGVLAPKSAKCYFGTMPRSTGVFVGATYNQLLTRTLPGLIAGWERLGYIMGHHYLITKRPSEKWIRQWNWKGPYRPPLDFKYFISWWNGAGAHLISQDRIGSSNGITIDFINGDEAKLLNLEKLQTELFAANRGIIPEFANNIYHHGMTFTSDMPVGTAGRWLLNKLDDMDKKTHQQLWDLLYIKHLLKLKRKGKSKAQQYEIDKQLIVIEDEIHDLRKGFLYYHEASSLDNIHALGVEFIKQQLRDTSQFQFDTQILNLRSAKLEDGFYPDFDEEYHGYFSEDESYFDNIDLLDAIGSIIGCRKDKDLNLNQPLHISLDYNRRIHPLEVAQVTDKEIKHLNALHSLYPEKLNHVLKNFCHYYKMHRNKVVYYWFDHTAVDEFRSTRICDDVMGYLSDNGWTVIPMYIGQAPKHERKYSMWGKLLNEEGYYDKKFRTNRENCKYAILSMNQAQAEYNKDGFGKDKRTERDPKFPAEESTHHSDALDTLVFGVLESGLNYITGEINKEAILIP